ncbi:class I SAM-dependent methyltransferase [Mechercharimyces sp. CAU 1602]|uniref:class I SAM-dependent methyltransferase n=1 Tax=Mechercharimyces sp. CAU 1602 TaxID=2973933 RepID=UPI002163D690|nr:class I SAM-dependent methyltransferase [Mechercharimyces sp. CAU 1602]MCS1351208.1 class I SAM-dependent methyltransferase [Mechercharimyces sp. CAU 1602]
MLVTTSMKAQTKDIALAEELAQRLRIPYIERQRHSIVELLDLQEAEQALLVANQQIRWQERSGDSFFFHPNLAALRVKQWKQTGNDSLIQVAGIEEGDEVLDCTLGMGADAVVAAHVVGSSGRVVGVESQPVIATIVAHGLKQYRTERNSLKEAMERVQVICADYTSYLAQCEDNAYDVILFDPMFRQTVKKSPAMQSLKQLANPQPLDDGAVKEAIRVARRKVVLKERTGSSEFERLGFTIVKESKRYALAVIETEEGK